MAPPHSDGSGKSSASGNGKDTLRTLNILHVEDDDIDAKIVALCLSQYRGRKINLIRATNAAHARKLIKSEDIDLVILDFWLGAESSLKLLSEVGGRGGLLPAIVMSGLSTPQTRQVVLKNGALAFLGKDRLTAGALEDVIESALQAFQSEAERTPLPLASDAVGLRVHQIEERFNDLLGFLDQMHDHAMMADMLPEQRASHLRALENIADDARAAIFSGIADLHHTDATGKGIHRIDMRLIVDEVQSLMAGILVARQQKLTCLRPDVALYTALNPANVTPLVAELVAVISRLTADGGELSLSTHFDGGNLCLTISGAPARSSDLPPLTVRLPSLVNRLQGEGINLNEDLGHADGPTLTIALPVKMRSK